MKPRWATLRERLRSLRRKEIAKGYSAFAAISGINLVVGVAMRFAIGGLLGAAVLGSFSLVVAIAAVIQQFFDVRVGNFTTRYTTEWLEKGDTEKAGALVKMSYIVDLLTGLFAFSVLFFGAEWITGSLYSKPQLSSFVQLYALVGLGGTVQHTADGVLKATARYRWISVSTIAMRLGELAAITVTAWIANDLAPVIIAIAIKEAVFSLLSMDLARRALRFEKVSSRSASLGVLRPHRREFFSFIFNTNLASYASVLESKLDVLILGRFISLSELGIYRLAVSVATGVSLVVQPLRQTLLQVFVRAREKGGEWLRNTIRQVTRFGGSIAFIAAALAASIGSSFINATLGTSRELFGLLILLAAKYVVDALFVWSMPLLLALDLMRYVGLRSLIYLTLYPALLVVGVLLGDLIGAAVAILLTAVIANAFTGYIGLKYVRRLHR